jgi:hypothetical protein
MSTQRADLSRRKLNRGLGISLCLVLIGVVALGQTTTGERPEPVQESEQVAVVARVAELIEARFYDREVAVKCAAQLRECVKRGEYRTARAPDEFAEQVTAQVRAALNDQHARVSFDPLLAAPTPEPTRESRDDELRESYRRRNFDFREVRLLEGNVGYLKLFTFAPARMGAEAAIAALHFLSNTDSVILDLRGNQGGYPDMGLLVASYFFERPTHYADIYRREGDRTEQQWTTSFVPGPRLARQDLFILLSRDSFSGAESLAYNLQALGRATIVGEQTRGGATGVNTLRVNERFQVAVADVNFTNPVTGTNWEAKGVVPDVPCSRADALAVAHQAALKRLAEKTTDPARSAELVWAQQLVAARAHPIALEPRQLREFAGQYGPRRVSFEADGLDYQRGEGVIHRLMAVGADLFMIDGIESFQLRFERNSQGSVIRAVGCYPDGQTDGDERVP